MLITSDDKDLDSIRIKVRLLASVAVICHFIYYFIWKEVFPQKYESFEVRALFVLIFFNWLVVDYYYRINDLFFRLVTNLTMLSISTFFSIMFLLNDFSTVWLGSFICGIFFLFLILNTIPALVMVILGSFISYLISIFGSDVQINNIDGLLESMPVIVFAVFGSIVFKYAEYLVIKDNHDKALSLAGSIAHELRTPMMGINLELEQIKFFYPSQENDFDLQESVSLISQHINKATNTVDCLLHNVRRGGLDDSNFSRLHMSDVIESALAVYPFAPSQKNLISISEACDFEFYGDSLLMQHVLFNLLKNSLRSIDAKGSGCIEIKYYRRKDENILLLRDTGLGISKDEIPLIFERFYSKSRGGAGLGLSFCKMVISSFNGAIKCRSIKNQFCEFSIFLKPIDPST